MPGTVGPNRKAQGPCGPGRDAASGRYDDGFFLKKHEGKISLKTAQKIVNKITKITNSLSHYLNFKVPKISSNMFFFENVSIRNMGSFFGKFWKIGFCCQEFYDIKPTMTYYD